MVKDIYINLLQSFLWKYLGFKVSDLRVLLILPWHVKHIYTSKNAKLRLEANVNKDANFPLLSDFQIGTLRGSHVKESPEKIFSTKFRSLTKG